MTITEYMERAGAFEADPIITITHTKFPAIAWNRLTHSGLGLATEAIEFGNATTLDNQIEELGDIAWFAALACRALGIRPAPEMLHPKDEARGKHIIVLCELFASRIKAGLFYGWVAKDTDSNMDAWAQIPARILLLCEQMSQLYCNGRLFESNIEKLTARYENKKFTPEQSIDRAPEVELAAIQQAVNIPQPAPTDPSLEEMRLFTANTRTGQIKLGD
jgi:hypothetical protein